MLKIYINHFDFDKDLDTTLIKFELKALILGFAKGPEKNSISLDLDNSISDEENPNSIAKKLFDAIKECKSPIKSINSITDLDTQLSKEIDLHQKVVELNINKLHTAILELFYQQVLIATSIFQRDRMSNYMLDALIFLKNYLKQ